MMSIESFESLLNEQDIQFHLCERNGNTFVAEIEFDSAAGEDVVETLWFTPETIVEDFYRLAEDFDPDEHAEKWVPVRGVNGVPNSIREIIDDADWIKKHLEDAARHVIENKKLFL